METLKKIVQKINKNKEITNEGFSLLELAVAVGILLVLTVTGLVSYNQIINNARDARVNNLAADLFMMGATNRSAGKNTTADSETLEQWANSNNMSFEKITDTDGCETYKNSVKGEALSVEYSVDKFGRISVYVENTNSGYNVDRKEPGFDISCGV